MTDNLVKWINQFHSGKVWLSKLKSKETIRVYLPNFKTFCDAVNKNPDQLIQMKVEGLKAVGTKQEFQVEETHDLVISELEAAPHTKANISMAVTSFFKHNRRPLVGTKKFDRPEAKHRTPSLSDVEEMASCACMHARFWTQGLLIQM